MSGTDHPMAEPRPAASLTGSLLARRGGARPAMRRQPVLLSMSSAAHDDLGWNDMGLDDPLPATPVAPAPVAEATPEPHVSPVPMSPVNVQIADLAERMRAPAPKKSDSGSRPASLSGAGHRAAFTLRIDAERHLRLRLLSTMTNRSAQRLLIDALDALIAGNDQLNALADQIESGQPADDAKIKQKA